MGGWGERRELGIRSWGLGKRGWGDEGMGERRELGIRSWGLGKRGWGDGGMGGKKGIRN
uniref:Uncharacterized protein n=1 Tax=Desertifilum tharense IPPAS B-1220 TaxID=1781255 RepID=A0ACD5GX51_9CYAN